MIVVRPLEELRACPFCGNEAIWDMHVEKHEVEDNKEVLVYRAGCGFCAITTAWHKDHTPLAYRWNGRMTDMETTHEGSTP